MIERQATTLFKNYVSALFRICCVCGESSGIIIKH